MALTLQNAVKQIEKLEAENEKLKEELAQFKRSPYFMSYVTILNQANDFCKQTQKPIDINDPESKEAFNMRWKFTQELPQLMVDLDALREKMLPQEQKEADKIREGSTVEIMVDKWKRKY